MRMATTSFPAGESSAIDQDDAMSVGQVIAFSIAVAALAGWALNWFIHIVALLYGKYKLHRPPPPISPEDLQGVSIIKPLTGVDPNLYYNLETFFNLNYPAYELMFSVHDEHDPAIMVVQKLIERYPKVDAKLFIGIKYVGPNGKINNMVKPFEASKYDVICISDSAIKGEPDTLLDLMGHMTPKVGMVLQMPFICDRKGFTSVYEKVFFGTMQSRNTLSACAVGIICATGMSCVIRKDVIEKAGGLASFGKYLAEDYFLAEACKAQGYQIALGNKCAMQNSGTYSMQHFHNRLVRWAKLRQAMLPTLIVLEPLSECFFQGVIMSLSMEYLFEVSAMAVFLLHVLVWFLIDYSLLTTTQGGPLSFNKFEFFAAWVLRECSSFYLTLRSHTSSMVMWRHRKYKLKWGGTVEEIR